MWLDWHEITNLKSEFIDQKPERENIEFIKKDKLNNLALWKCCRNPESEVYCIDQ